MASTRRLGLPPITAELKPISPYLQRAEELNSTEPVVAYWCAYYAAQLGISLKAKDAPSRNLLFELLGKLEKMKLDIGPNDAVDIESASAAYVENFALKVFTMADNEDRQGQATRSTAKKFLAAANFLEVLKTFPKAEVSDSNEEKIKYAKWKAADIAKAWREGRRPVPGPAGSDLSAEVASIPDPNSQMSLSTDTLQAPPPRNDIPLGDFLNPTWGGQGDITPGSWSTAATPGSAPADTSGDPLYTEASHSPDMSATQGMSIHYEGGGDTVDATTDAKPQDPSNMQLPEKRAVHFSPSAIDGVSSSFGVSLPPSASPTKPSFDIEQPQQPFLPTSNRLNTDIYQYTTPQSYGANPTAGVPAFTRPPVDLPSAPPMIVPPVPPPPVPVQFHPPISAYEPTPEMSPATIAKAQKHCRFAISSLDYEDIEQAKKELRAALSILGG